MLIPTHLGTFGAMQDATNDLFDMLIGRNEDLEKEKLGVLSDNDALVAENIKLRAELAEQAKQLATMRAA